MVGVRQLADPRLTPPDEHPIPPFSGRCEDVVVLGVHALGIPGGLDVYGSEAIGRSLDFADGNVWNGKRFAGAESGRISVSAM